MAQSNILKCRAIERTKPTSISSCFGRLRYTSPLYLTTRLWLEVRYVQPGAQMSIIVSISLKETFADMLRPREAIRTYPKHYLSTRSDCSLSDRGAQPGLCRGEIQAYGEGVLRRALRVLLFQNEAPQELPPNALLRTLRLRYKNDQLPF